MSNHARFSPSSSARWLSCTMSLILEKKFSEKFSPTANRGTALHNLAHDLLENKPPQKTYNDYVPTLKDYEEVIEPYLNYLKDIKHDFVLLEQKVEVNNDCYGTADAILYESESKTLHIIDLKCGRTLVKVKNNSQLKIYAVGAIKKLLNLGKTVSKVTTHIVQPSVDNIKSHSYTIKELTLFKNKLEDTILKIKKNEGEYKTSEENCKYCPHVTYCIAVENKIKTVKYDDFENVELSEKLDLLPILKIFIKEIEQRAMDKLLVGEVIENYTLKAGRKLKKWKDEKEVINFLTPFLQHSHIFETKINSVAKIEKIIKTKKIDIDITKLYSQESTTVNIVRSRT